MFLNLSFVITLYELTTIGYFLMVIIFELKREDQCELEISPHTSSSYPFIVSVHTKESTLVQNL